MSDERMDVLLSTSVRIVKHVLRRAAN